MFVMKGSLTLSVTFVPNFAKYISKNENNIFWIFVKNNILQSCNKELNFAEQKRLREVQ